MLPDKAAVSNIIIIVISVNVGVQGQGRVAQCSLVPADIARHSGDFGPAGRAHGAGLVGAEDGVQTAVVNFQGEVC